MARRRDEGFGGVFAQLRPLKWLGGISMLILLITIVVFYFHQDSQDPGPKQFVLAKGELLVQDRDFVVTHYDEEGLTKLLPAESAHMLKKNMDLIALTHVEMVKTNVTFTKGYEVHFRRPEDLKTRDQLAASGLRVAYWSTLEEQWRAYAFPMLDAADGIIYKVPSKAPGYFALGRFSKDAGNETDPTKTDPDKADPAKEDPTKTTPSPEVKPEASKGLALRVPVRVRGDLGLRKSEHLALWLEGLRDSSPLNPIADIGAKIVAEIRGNPGNEPLLDPSLQLRWYLDRTSRQDGIPEKVNLLSDGVWHFDGIPTHRAAEWLIIFEFVDLADGRVIAEGEVPLSVRARPSD